MSLSSTEWEVQKEGAFWKEVTEELHAWIQDIQGTLEDPDAEIGLKELHQGQGGLKVLRNLINLPDVILESKKLDEGRDEKEIKDNG